MTKQEYLRQLKEKPLSEKLNAEIEVLKAEIERLKTPPETKTGGDNGTI